MGVCEDCRSPATQIFDVKTGLAPPAVPAYDAPDYDLQDFCP